MPEAADQERDFGCCLGIRGLKDIDVIRGPEDRVVGYPFYVGAFAFDSLLNLPVEFNDRFRPLERFLPGAFLSQLRRHSAAPGIGSAAHDSRRP